MLKKTGKWTGIGAVIASSLLLLSACSTGTTPEAEEPADPGNGSSESSNELYDLLPDDVKSSGVLIVGTDPGYPPCDFINDETGEIDGYNHEILKTMEPHLGVTIEQEAVQFDGLIP